MLWVYNFDKPSNKDSIVKALATIMAGAEATALQPVPHKRNQIRVVKYSIHIQCISW